jgi:hypothetical protein
MKRAKQAVTDAQRELVGRLGYREQVESALADLSPLTLATKLPCTPVAQASFLKIILQVVTDWLHNSQRTPRACIITQL